MILATMLLMATIEFAGAERRLFLVADTKKIDYSNILSKWNNYTFVYFVKIYKDKYLDDLDQDRNLEFALYPMIAGNNPVTDAYTPIERKNQAALPKLV